MKRMLAPLAALLVLALPSAAAGARGGPVNYTATLTPLNGSGVRGSATLTRRGDTITVAIEATGLEPAMLHPQHIHGFADGGDATCPTAAADANGDGLVDLAEGLPFYGPVLLPLTPFPTADEHGTVTFRATYALPRTIRPLQKTTIVLHGLTVGGTYVATLPVACGEIRVSPGRQDVVR